MIVGHVWAQPEHGWSWNCNFSSASLSTPLDCSLAIPVSLNLTSCFASSCTLALFGISFFTWLLPSLFLLQARTLCWIRPSVLLPILAINRHLGKIQNKSIIFPVTLQQLLAISSPEAFQNLLWSLCVMDPSKHLRDCAPCDQSQIEEIPWLDYGLLHDQVAFVLLVALDLAPTCTSRSLILVLEIQWTLNPYPLCVLMIL